MALERHLVLNRLFHLLRAGRFPAPGSTLLKTIPDAGRLTWDDIQKLYPVLRQLDQYVERLMSC